MRPKVLLTRELPPQAMQLLQAHTDLEWNREDRVMRKAEIIEKITNKDGLLCLLTDTIDAEIMDANPQLKLIANYAVGFNNIDLAAAKSRNILVSNTPGVLTEATAELAMTLLCSLARRVVESDRFLRSGQWNGWGPMQYLGKEIFGSTLGILGLGRIGKALVRRAQAFGMKVCYWNRTRLSAAEEKALNLDFQPVDSLLQSADFISIHLAYTPATHHFLDKERLAKIKTGSFIINTARGPIIDEAALVEALQSGHLGGAGLDVYEREPEVHSGLIGLSNVVLLPHLGSATLHTRTQMGLLAVENLLAGLRGETPGNLVID